jgi:hypothetical protein
MESEVEAALVLLTEQGKLPRADVVKSLVAPEKATVPEMAAYTVDLFSYDRLLVEECAR